MKHSARQLASVWIWVGVTTVVCLLDGGCLPAFDLGQRLEWITYDWRVRRAVAHPATNASNLGFVFISEESIAALLDGTLDYKVGLYWPRHVYGRLLQELSTQGAAAVGFDILFPNLRPDHPPALLPDGQEQSSDEFFARQLRAAGNVVVAADKGALPAELFRTNAWAVGSIGAQPESDGILRRIKAYEDLYVWHPLISLAARRTGFDLRQPRFESTRLVFRTHQNAEHVIPLQNGRFNQAALYEELLGSKPPANAAPFYSPATQVRAWDLGIVLAARALGLDLSRARIEPGQGRIVLAGPDGLQRTIPIDRQGFLYIDWSMTPASAGLTKESIESLLLQEQARRLGQTGLLTNRWANKLAVVGSIAVGNDLTDLGATPLEKQTYLVSRYWNVANSVLIDRFPRPVPWPVRMGLVALLCILTAALTWKLRPLPAACSILGLAALYIVLALHCYVQNRLWLPVFLPLTGLVLCYFSLVSYKVLVEQQERRRIRAIFAKVVAPSVVTELLKEQELPLKGLRQELTVFFADIRGFTAISELANSEAEAYVRARGLHDREAEEHFNLRTQQVLQTINLYLSSIAEIIKNHEGTLDKYIGDCVMAFWGSPTPNPKHALAAVQTAIEVQRAIRTLNRERAAENLERERVNRAPPRPDQPPLLPLSLLELGIGINTGNVIVGLMGSRDHIVNYTVFGRDVNLASRLEALCPRSRIVIGETTYLRILQEDPNLASTCLEMEPTIVKGFRDPVKIFQVPWQG